MHFVRYNMGTFKKQGVCPEIRKEDFTMKYTKIVAVLLALAMCIAAFAACAKDTDAGSDATDATEAPAAADIVKTVDISLTDELYAFGVSKTDEELQQKTNEYIAQIKADGTLDGIMDKYFGNGTPTAVTSAEEDESKDQLVVATNAAFPPFEYTEGADYLGVDMEIMAGLAEFLGKKLVIKNIDFKSVFETVDKGYADITASGITVNEERKNFVTFSDSYYTASQLIIASAGDTTFDGCKTLEDVEAILNGFDASVKIGVQEGTTAQFYVEGDEEWGFDGIAATCQPYANGAQAVNDMVNGNINYVIIDEGPAHAIVDSVNGK